MRHYPLPTMLGVLLGMFVGAAQAAPPEESGNLILRTGWVHFDMVSGRIRARRAHYIKSKTAAVRTSGAGVNQSLRVAFDRFYPTVRYERLDAGQSFILEMEDNGLIVQSELFRPDHPVSVSYVQTKSGTHELTVRETESERRYRAPSFWHLILAEPAACREHLLPILENLHRDWHLDQAARHLKETLRDMSTRDLQLTQRQFNLLVGQLDSDRYRDRQAADRRLRDMGRIATSYLAQINPAGLSAEQQLRVRRILFDLATDQPDTARSVAVELAGNPAVFVILLEDEDADTRAAAAAHLAIILERPLDIDPHGDKEVRARQVDQICRQLGIEKTRVKVGAKTGSTRRLR